MPDEPPLCIVSVKSNDGESIATLKSELPSFVSGGAVEFPDLSKRHSVAAGQCIYCGSLDQLSNEHIIPRAWGGVQQILRGSCEACRKLTSDFETKVLRQENMALVRQHVGIRSRSRHASAQHEVELTVIRDGAETVESLPAADAPLLLGFPWFSPPALLREEASSSLVAEGWFTARFGADPLELCRSLGATSIRLEERRIRPVAFAQVIAKIAYAHAWQDNVIELLNGPSELVEIFMHRPDEIGMRVGMKPQPIEHYPGLFFRLSYALDASTLSVVLEVQPFANLPAPIYLVVLGTVSSLRHWREVKKRSIGARH